jgi:pyrroloquinoline quinone biosynthesis protein D
MPSTMRMPTDSGAGPVGPANQPRPTSRPRLAPHVRLKFDPARQQHVLLTPETVILLNDTGAAILELCDGQRTVAEILTELRDRYDRVADDEVRLFLADLLVRRRMEVSRG